MLRWLLLVLVLPITVWAAPSIQVTALFKNQAMISVNGKPVLFKPGQQKQGIKLLAATSKLATIEVAGEVYQLGLSQRVASQFKAVTKDEVLMTKSRNGQYFVAGTILNQPANMLVDTGAYTVVLNSNHAKAFGVDYRMLGIKTGVSTASGRTESYAVTLASVGVGNIQIANVSAVVIEGNYPEVILLGMSYLQHVKIEEDQGVMRLEKKY